jgi:hypothetical protein
MPSYKQDARSKLLACPSQQQSLEAGQPPRDGAGAHKAKRGKATGSWRRQLFLYYTILVASQSAGSWRLTARDTAPAPLVAELPTN